MELLIMGAATFLNFALLKWKLQKNRFADFALDLVVLVALSYMFGGTLTGMSIAMVAGFMMSLYLAFSPPKFFQEAETA